MQFSCKNTDYIHEIKVSCNEDIFYNLINLNDTVLVLVH